VIAGLTTPSDRPPISTQLFILLGGAAFIGWLLSRHNPEITLAVPPG
jgi:hypothetical protein